MDQGLSVQLLHYDGLEHHPHYCRLGSDLLVHLSGTREPPCLVQVWSTSEVLLWLKNVHVSNSVQEVESNRQEVERSGPSACV